MGKFSTDRSILEYCKNIWDLSACPIDPELFGRVKRAYLESTPISLL
jgi:hypothetical protein